VGDRGKKKRLIIYLQKDCNWGDRERPTGSGQLPGSLKRGNFIQAKRRGAKRVFGRK